MKIRALLDYIAEVTPHVFPESVLLMWLNELEGRVQLDILLREPGEVVRYTLPADEGTELIVPMPHGRMYRFHLQAMIQREQGEYSKYQNTMQSFNNAWNEYACWHAETGQAGEDAT